MTAYVYMLSCADGSLYTGWTNDLAKRLENHQAGKGAKYTRGRLPVTLAYYETYETESEARKRECAIKKLTRQQKEKLIQTKPEQIAD
ncbi:MAG: GIY-YIG nuclease family protein [Selenomonadales bacterium]|jgi:putative endonuclease|nr:GIY-YIG nuclease family protein [Selenomonadales bacterium]MBQ5588165.1 GIY-YIG nuclease family protein [Selenomonadales bacterium]MBQ5746126.1 GIY-YIG nuclease family protein [Selenomonadales bacterium]MBR0325510.1 GIY-YIG nuclease family protein [Selenomonadales bacterium]